MFRRITIISIVVFSSLLSDAQYSMLDFSLDYFSNTSSFGQLNQITKQPSVSLSASYFDKSNFNLSFISNYIENSDENFENGTYEFDIIIGYTFEIGKHFSVYPNYSHFFYDENANIMYSSYSNNFALDVGLSYKKANSSISLNYLTGDSNEYFVSLQNFLVFNIENVVYRASILSLEPELSLNFGNQTYYNNYIWLNYQNNPDYKEDLLNRNGVQRSIRSLQHQYPNLTEDQIIQLISTQYQQEEESFNLSSISITLPISYMLGNVGFNSSLTANILTNKPDYVEDNYQIYFNLGVSYSFFRE